MADANKTLSSEEVRAKVIEEYGLDEETHSELIDRLANKHLEHQKELSKAIDKKAEYRKMLVEKGLIDPKTHKPVEAQKEPEGKKSGELDYGQKAYLKASGIKAEEFGLVQEIMSQTGKDLDSVLESKYFQAELKDSRELAAAQQATPSSTKRAGSNARDSVDYWMAKGELPPADQADLRRKVVNARMKVDTDGSKFTDSPIGNVIRG
jgi:hypothetical protein